MSAFLGYACFALALFVALVMLLDETRGRVRLLSIRNVFLLGFIVFQLLSGGYALSVGMRPDQFIVQDHAGTGMIYLVSVVLFLTLFFIAYLIRTPLVRLADRVPDPIDNPSQASMFIISAALIVAVVVLRLVPIPYIGVLTRYMSVGLAAVSAGLAAWVWAPRIFNPVVALYAIILIGTNWAIVNAGYGRRDELSVLMAAVWGGFYSWFGFYEVRKYMIPLLVFGLVGMMLMGMVTSVRGQIRDRDLGVFQQARYIISSGDPLGSFEDVATGQGAAQNTMWIMENYPDRFDYEPFRLLLYIFEYPIPREIYKNKPVSVGNDIVAQANVTGVSKAEGDGKTGFNVGPGILGQAWVDGGFFFVGFYGVFFGIIIRFFDQVLHRDQSRVFLVLPIGCCLGQLIGVPRGGVAYMTFIFLFTTITVYTSMIMLSWIMGLFKPRSHADLENYGDDDQLYGIGDESRGYG